MSGEQGIFASIQLRSSTPAPNEKVFQFLQGMAMAGEEPDNTPPRSVADANEFRSRAESARSRSPQIYSPAPKSKASATLIGPPGFENAYPQKTGSKVNVVPDDIAADDVDSNVQDGVRSEVGEMMPFHPEPGPHDPPGPKYESYDSGPSFGNFGPLPTDDHPNASNNPYAHSSWNPNWTDIVNKPSNGVQRNATGLTEGGLSAYPAALPSTPPAYDTAQQTAVIIDIHSPSTKSRAASERDVTTSPKPPSRAQSRATNKGEVDQRPWSPLSGRSKGTRATEKGTVYPPLPESRMGDGDTKSDRIESYGSPGLKSRARSMAPSISPSESPSHRVQNVQVFASKPQYSNGGSRSPPPASVSHQSRPFSPYRHAPTQEDLLNAAVRGRSLVIPEEPERERSVASTSPSKIPSRQSKVLSHIEGGILLSQLPEAKQPSVVASAVPSRISRSARSVRDQDVTPTPSRPHSPRPHSPEGLDDEEARIVNDALAAQTPRTSIYAAPLEPEVASHYHDMELCVLLHQENDPAQHEIVKKALRKAVRQRVKKLGMKYDTESIRQYRKSFHDHDPSVHLRADYLPEEPPKWASDLKREIVLMQQRIESLGPKIEGLRDKSFNDSSRFANEAEESTEFPMTQTVNIQTQPTGTMADSMYHTPVTDVFIDDDGNVVREFDDFTENHNPHTDAETRSLPGGVYQQSENDRDDSPGKQYLEEELYKLRQKPHGSQSGLTHRTWELARGDDHDDYEENDHVPPSGLPTIPDTNGEGYVNGEGDGDRSSPPLPELPEEATQAMAVHSQGIVDYNTEVQRMSPWQRIHGRLLSWAIVWPMSELENALNSSTRGQQVDEVALTIWSTQTYKRYVRARLTDGPHGVVDRLFVPPNVADTISNAVFNGRHGDACGMLRDLWAPFGLEGMPRLLVVLAKHRSDPHHWVVHRFSLPDGGLTTYDSYPERTLPDGRPLGWWFAIRVAWPNAMYPSPDHLMQKMVRLHRPMQMPIDNSVAAAGIWRNILMGSRAERSLDLERLRDLINTEVKNLKQRKNLGKLSVSMSRPAREE